MCLVMELFIVLPVKAISPFTHKPTPNLKFVELTSFDDIPENIIYNKVVSVTNPEFLDKQICNFQKELYNEF